MRLYKQKSTHVTNWDIVCSWLRLLGFIGTLFVLIILGRASIARGDVAAFSIVVFTSMAALCKFVAMDALLTLTRPKQEKDTSRERRGRLKKEREQTDMEALALEHELAYLGPEDGPWPNLELGVATKEDDESAERVAEGDFTGGGGVVA